MAADPHKSTNDPQPAATPGLEHGAGVPAGETPPGSDQMSGAAASPAERESVPDRGPKIAMGIILLFALVVGALFIAMAVVFATQ